MELLLVALLAALCALGRLPISCVACELIANAGFQIGIGTLLLAGFWLVRPLTRTAGLAALALAAFQLAPVAMLHLAPNRAPPTGTNLRIASANLLYGNEDPRAFHAWLEIERPAVLGLLEISPTWKQVLDLERSLLPHQRIVDVAPRLLGGRSFAIGIASRHPLRSVTVRGGEHGEIPWLDVEVEVDERLVRVLVIHAMGPREASQLRARDRLFEELVTALNEPGSLARPTCLIGDFNATIYSHALTNAIERTPLRDARRGHGREPTWFPFRHSGFGLLGLDLDHAFLSPDIAVIDHRVGPDIGSDHRPIVIDIGLP